MTRREQFIKSRAWLRMHNYIITHSLRERLKSLPMDEWANYCYIQNLVIIHAHEYEHDLSRIPVDIWKTKMGGRYHIIIPQLEAWGELEVKYDHIPSKNKTGRPRGYSIPPKAMDSGVVVVDLARKRIRLPKPKNYPIDPVSQYVLDCLRQLKVAEVLAYPPTHDPHHDPDIRKTRIRWHCEHILAGDYSLHYGKKVNRLYHRVLSMPSEGRCNLTHCFPLAEYDVKTCHPLLMLKFFQNPQERAAYAQMLAGDIYQIIGQEMHEPSRDAVKENFQKVVNAGKKYAVWMANQIVYQFFHQHFPDFAEKVLFARNDLATVLQRYEAKLMVQQLGQYCLENNLFWIPMHDGFISRLDQGHQIMDIAKQIISEAVGIIPQIDPEPIKYPLL